MIILHQDLLMCCWIQEHIFHSLYKIINCFLFISLFLHFYSNNNQRMDFICIMYKSDIFLVIFLSKIKIIFTLFVL